LAPTLNNFDLFSVFETLKNGIFLLVWVVPKKLLSTFF
jgi:hypothetical protein